MLPGVPTLTSWEDVLARAHALAAGAERRVLGIAGPPGAGKSTVAARIAADLGEAVRLAPMDGFHLAQAELRRLGRDRRKGAIDTFDAAGYLALLRRLRDPAEKTVYAPEFRREIEEPIACAIAIPAEVPLVVAEGNYLLAWEEVRAALDETWYVAADEALRVERLIQRHVDFGKPPDVASEWVHRSDQRNAELVEATRGLADVDVAIPW